MSKHFIIALVLGIGSLSLGAQEYGIKMYSLFYNETGQVIHYNEQRQSFDIAVLSICSEFQQCLSFLEINSEDMSDFHITSFDSLNPAGLLGEDFGQDQAFILGSHSFDFDSLVYLVEFTKAGNMEDWIPVDTVTFKYEGYNLFQRTVRILEDGNLFIYMFTDSPAYTEKTWYLCYDPIGDSILWETREDLTPHFRFNDVTDAIATADGGLLQRYFADSARSGVELGLETFPAIMKFDSKGRIEWLRGYDGIFGGGPGYSVGRGLATDGNRVYLGTRHGIDTLEGHSSSEFPYDIVSMILCIDSLGDELWRYAWADEWGDKRRYIGDITIARNGDIIIGGAGSPHLWDEEEIDILTHTGWITRLTPDGKVKWHRDYYDNIFYEGRYIGTGAITDIMELPNGNIAATGVKHDTTYADGTVWIDFDVLLLQVDSNGCIDPGCVEEKVFVTSTLDLPHQREIDYNVYPNPFQDRLTFYLDTECRACVFQLIDLQGRAVYRHRGITRGENHFTLPQLQEGMYIYQIWHENQLIQSEKVLKYGY